MRQIYMCVFCIYEVRSVFKSVKLSFKLNSAFGPGNLCLSYSTVQCIFMENLYAYILEVSCILQFLFISFCWQPISYKQISTINCVYYCHENCSYLIFPFFLIRMGVMTFPVFPCMINHYQLQPTSSSPCPCSKTTLMLINNFEVSDNGMHFWGDKLSWTNTSGSFFSLTYVIH